MASLITWVLGLNVGFLGAQYLLQSSLNDAETLNLISSVPTKPSSLIILSNKPRISTCSLNFLFRFSNSKILSLCHRLFVWDSFDASKVCPSLKLVLVKSLFNMGCATPRLGSMDSQPRHGEPHRTHPPPHIAHRVHCRALFYMSTLTEKAYKFSLRDN